MVPNNPVTLATLGGTAVEAVRPSLTFQRVGLVLLGLALAWVVWACVKRGGDYEEECKLDPS